MAELDIDGRLVRVPLGVEEMLHYAHFQAAVLSKTGLMYLYAVSEGRPVDLADYFWRNLVSVLLERETPDKAPAATPTARTAETVN